MSGHLEDDWHLELEYAPPRFASVDLDADARWVHLRRMGKGVVLVTDDASALSVYGGDEDLNPGPGDFTHDLIKIARVLYTAGIRAGDAYDMLRNHPEFPVRGVEHRGRALAARVLSHCIAHDPQQMSSLGALFDLDTEEYRGMLRMTTWGVLVWTSEWWRPLSEDQADILLDGAEWVDVSAHGVAFVAGLTSAGRLPTRDEVAAFGGRPDAPPPAGATAQQRAVVPRRRRRFAPGTPTYHGVVEAAGPVPALDRLATLAYAGRWNQVLALLDASPRGLSPNRWRTTGTSWYTPLHQAAWHGAPADVIERLIALGAWRTLRTAEGLRPVDIAVQRGLVRGVLDRAPREPPVRQELVADDVGFGAGTRRHGRRLAARRVQRRHGSPHPREPCHGPRVTSSSVERRPAGRERPTRNGGRVSTSTAATPAVRWVPYGPSAIGELQQEIAAAKGDDPLQRVTVVVPTKVSGLGLRRELSSRRGGSVGVSYLVMAQLAEHLAAGRVAASGRKPLTDAVREEVVRESLRQAPGSLGGLATHPATVRVLDEAFAVIREATAVAGEESFVNALRANRQALPKTVAEAFSAFRKLTAPTRYDEHDLALLAAEAVESDPGDPLRDVGPVIIYLPSSVSPAVTRLVAALATATRVTMLLGRTGDPGSDAVTADVAARLTGVDIEVPNDGAEPAVAPLEAIVVPDAEEEVRQAARIVTAALHAGRDISRFAILYRAREPYATLIHELLAAARVPHNGPTERMVRQTMAGRFLWDLWDWVDSGHPRSELFDVLGSIPVRHDGERAPAQRWDRIARKARVIGGRQHWERRLEGFATECDRDREGSPAWLAERLARDRDLARELKRFVLELADALEPPEESTWTGWSRWALGLLDTYLGTGRRGWPDTDIEAEGTLRQQLTAMAQLDELPTELGTAPRPVTSDDARSAVAAILDEPAGRVGRAGSGVYVGPLGTAGNLNLDHAIILGAVEGQFPPSPRESVILPGAVLTKIRESGTGDPALAQAIRGVPSRADTVASARQALYRVLAASGEVTMTVPRADRREQRAKIPGPWLLELLTRQNGDGVRVTVAKLLEKPQTVTGARAVASSVAGLRDAATGAGVDEVRLGLLSDYVDAGGDPAGAPILESTPAARNGVDITRRRRGAAFTEFDGHVVGAEEILRDRLKSPQSPGTLADYASCPRRYLFTQVLGVRTEEKPRRWLDVDALDRGNLVHDTLELWVREVLRPSSVPDGSSPAGSEERLFEVLDEQIGAFEATGRVGIPALWEVEKARIRRRLRVWLGQEEVLRSRFGVAPAEVEMPFGMGEAGAGPLQVETTAGVPLTLRGKVDRIDASDDGGRVVVTDYKTSKPGTYKLEEDIAQEGTELQLPIYGLAAARKYPDAEISVGYWHIHSQATEKEPQLVPFDEAARERTQQVLDTIAEGVTSGVFPADPGGETLYPRPTFDHCKYCVFDRICPSHAERARAAERDFSSEEARVLLPLVQPTPPVDGEESV